MSLTNGAETDLLELIFQNVDWANIGDAAGILGSTADGSFYISLHTADPGEAGDQTTSEASYTGYARVAVARSVAGFTVSGNEVSNAGAVTFPESTSGPQTVTHFGVGRANAGAGQLLLKGALSSPAGGLIVNPGIAPNFAAGQLTATVD